MRGEISDKELATIYNVDHLAEKFAENYAAGAAAGAASRIVALATARYATHYTAHYTANFKERVVDCYAQDRLLRNMIMKAREDNLK